MSVKKIVLSVFVFCISITVISAQPENKLAAAVEKLRIAMIEADAIALEKITSPQLSYGHSNGYVEGKKEFIEKLVSGQSDFVTIELTNQTISIDKKTAIVRHQLFAKTNDNGKPGEVKLNILLIWVKKKGDWKLLARQAVRI